MVLSTALHGSSIALFSVLQQQCVNFFLQPVEGPAGSKVVFSASCTPIADTVAFNIKREATWIGVSNQTVESNLTRHCPKHAMPLMLHHMGNRMRANARYLGPLEHRVTSNASAISEAYRYANIKYPLCK